MANNAIQKISARAKQIRKKSPAKSWKACIKEASREYNSGSLGSAKRTTRRAKRKVAKKVKYRQTGTSNRKVDSQRKAKRPGKRRTSHGTTYTERRKNRSDAPGKLSGTAYNEMILRNLRQRNLELAEAVMRLTRLKDKVSANPMTKSEKIVYRRMIKDQNKHISTIKKELRMLRMLVK